MKKFAEYYIAIDISSTYNGMLIAVPEQQWNIFRQASTEEMAALLLELASRIDLLKFKKHKRRPKKISPKKNITVNHMCLLLDCWDCLMHLNRAGL